MDVLCTITAVVVFHDSLLFELSLLLPLLGSTLLAGELSRNDHLISSTSNFHPFAYPLLALARLVVDCCVNEVTTLFIEVIQHGECGFLGAFSECLLPRLAKVH